MHMSPQPQVIRQCDCYPGVSLLCVLGVAHLPKGEIVFKSVITSCFPSER